MAIRAAAGILIVAAGLTTGVARAAPDVSYLVQLLDAIPDGGWAKASTNRYSDAWVVGSNALPGNSYSLAGSIVRAWSSFAWDANRAALILWGGGHANYMGNEVYIWQGTNGAWTRGSVSSRLEQYGATATYFTIDNAAPQSAHTYDNNVFLPVNDMFLTFGGASFNDGAPFVTKGPGGTPVPAGPWVWDPRKANPDLVGGTTGSAYDPATVGGQMWANLYGLWTGAGSPSYVNGTTGYRQEDGRDVVYVTGDANASGWPSLYRLELGDLRSGATSRFEKVGVTLNVPGYQSAAVIDTRNGLYVRIADVAGWPTRLAAWKLANSDPDNPGSNADIPVDLVLGDGTPFDVSRFDGIAYDEILDEIVLWDGSDRGTVWVTRAVVDLSGTPVGPWVVEPRSSTTSAQPNGNFVTGVLGKWHYVRDIAAFVALDEFDPVTDDAVVWLYKPYGWQRPDIGGNVPPSVSLDAPSPGSAFDLGAPVTLQATAYDSDGTVTRVDFYEGATLIGSDATAPYGIVWTAGPLGTRTLTAHAFDDRGGSTISQPVQLTVTNPAPVQVAGTVRLGATGLSGIALQGTGGATCTTSDATGAYACTVPWGWSGSVTPAAGGLVFTPVSRAYVSVTANVADDDYSAAPAPAVGSLVWFDDALPTGAVPQAAPWLWVGDNPGPNSGTRALSSDVSIGLNDSRFTGASATLAIGAGDVLFAYVYLPKSGSPTEIMLQWHDGMWEHRAYWGANAIAEGVDGTASRRYMGPLPPTGAWTKLEVPASLVDLQGRTVSGMSLAAFGGRALWDTVGKSATQP